MHGTRRMAFALTAILATGALLPVASASARAGGTAVTISGIAFNSVDGVPVDRIDVLYANPSTYVPAKDLVRGPSLEASDIADDGHFALTVPAGKAFYLRLVEDGPSYLPETFVGAGGATSSAYLTLDPIVTTTALDLGGTDAILAGTVTINSNHVAATFALFNLNDGEAYQELAQPSARSHTISRVAPGRYRAKVYDRYATGSTTSPEVITVAAGSHVTAEVTQPGFAKVTGQVLDRAGKPLPEVGVSARRTGSERGVSRSTDKFGRYSLTGLLPGTYTVTYRGIQDTTTAAYLSTTRKVTLRAGDAPALSPVTLTKGGVVAGSVLKGITTVPDVFLLTSSGKVVSWRDGVSSDTARTFSWRTRGVKTGTYTLIVELNGKYLTRKVTVTAGKVTKLGLLRPHLKPHVVTGRIPSAHGGWITVYTKHVETRSYTARARIGSTGRFTLHVIPGTWLAHVKGGPWEAQVESKVHRVKITTATRTLTLPVRRLTSPVTSSVTFRGNPIVGLAVTTLNIEPRDGKFASRNFTVTDYDSPGRYSGTWGTDTPPSRVFVNGEGDLLPGGPYYFATTVPTVSSPADVKRFSLVIAGGE